jgi:dihydrofolate reductase
VLSRQAREIKGVRTFTDLAVLDHLDTDQTIWIAGGGEVYQQMLNKCSELYLTRVHRTLAGDAHFPEFEDAFKLEEIIEQNDDFTIERWVKL